MNWGFGEVLWFRRATGTPAETLRTEAARQTAVLQNWLAAHLGAAPWFGGEAFMRAVPGGWNIATIVWNGW